MKKLLLLLVAISLLALVGCGSDKDEKGGVGNSPHPNVITGKIIEIKDNNTILLQITKERGGYKVDDKVLIKYDRFKIIKSDGGRTLGNPSLNDEVSTHFWPDELKKKDGYDYIEVDPLEKYIN